MSCTALVTIVLGTLNGLGKTVIVIMIMITVRIMIKYDSNHNDKYKYNDNDYMYHAWLPGFVGMSVFGSKVFPRSYFGQILCSFLLVEVDFLSETVTFNNL